MKKLIIFHENDYSSITLPLISSSFHFIVSCPQFYHRTHSSQTHYIGFLALAEESDSSGSGESSNKLFVTAICLPRKFRDLSTSLESREPTEILLPSFPRHAYNASRNISIGNSPYEIFERNNVRGRRAYRVPDDCLSIIRGQPLCLPSSRFMPFLVCTTDTHAEGWNYYYQRNFVPRYLAFESMM